MNNLPKPAFQRGVQYNPPEMISLQREIRNHPVLVMQLKTESDFANWMATAATYVGTILDGYYAVDQFPGLCEHLTAKLIKLRTALVVSQSPSKERH